MVSWRETTASWVGVLRLAAGREDWAEKFDMSADGFFRSFYALLIASPLAILVQNAAVQSLAALPDAELGEPRGGLFWLSVGVVMFFINALATIALVAFIARSTGYGGRFSAFAIAYNWMTLLVYTVAAPVGLFHSVGLVSPSFVVFAAFVIFTANLVFFWRVLSKTLVAPFNITLIMFLGTIVLTQVMGLAVNSLADAIAPQG